ncbi:hypothetical protein KL931_003748 [Ogataea haglerorum]|nr:hypothetical protein KL931_003748 [Ogataea haglerorum]
MPLLRSSRRLRSDFGELPADYADESHDEEIPQVDLDEVEHRACARHHPGARAARGKRHAAPAGRPSAVDEGCRLRHDHAVPHHLHPHRQEPAQRVLLLDRRGAGHVRLHRVRAGRRACAREQLAADEVRPDPDGGVPWAEQQRDHCAHAGGVLRLHDPVLDVHGDVVCVSDPVSDVVAGEKVAGHREAGDGDNRGRRGLYIEKIIRYFLLIVSMDKRPFDQLDPESTPTPVSETPSKRATPDPAGTTVSGGSSKVPAHVLQKRREGRLRAMEKLQNRLDELGIKRVDQENALKFSSIPLIQAINQKNYYTDYLKKDDQVMMIREMRQRLLEARLAKKQAELERKQESQNMINKINTHGFDFDDNEDDEDDDDNGKMGSRIIVLHPGSANIRIGLSSDVDPLVVPNMVAHRRPAPKASVDPQRREDENGDMSIADEHFVAAKRTVTSNFKERMKFYKRRILPNSNEQCYNYNKRVQPETIPELDDVHKLDYFEKVRENYVTGADVLKIKDLENWQVRSPFLNGRFNDKDVAYRSEQDLLGDVKLILTDALKRFNVFNRKTLNTYNCVLVIPNLYDKVYCEKMVGFLFNLGFGQVAVFQEGLAATFGSGVSSACVVDIGATSTKVCCIEEGYIFPDSVVELSYGSNDITRALIKSLIGQQFPYRNINLNELRDWTLATQLKENIVTFNDANVAVQIFKFVNRRPGQLSEKYEFKSFDDVMVTPMGLFYPELFLEAGEAREESTVLGKWSPNKKLTAGLMGSQVAKSTAQKNETERKLISEMDTKDLMDQLVSSAGEEAEAGDGETDDKVTQTNDFRVNMTPLDKAIIESITYAASGDQQRLEKLYQNILIVGGGSKIEGLDTILVDRLHLNRAPLLASSKLAEITKQVQQWKDKEKALSEEHVQEINNKVASGGVTTIEIIANDENLDPSMLVWKGASVFARLKIVEEMWIGEKYWDIFGGRALSYTTLFNY